ncbi:MAG: chlorophyll synthesis pathway protein BchC [Pseudomonadota bacterium]
MNTLAVLLKGPEDLQLDTLALKPPGEDDIVVEISHSGISTGTEKLFWSGQMPPFPGMGYPLVPGYESVGKVIEAQPGTGYKPGDTVFVPGADCFSDAFGLFGGAAATLVTKANRVTGIDSGLGAEGALLALAATAHHAIQGPGYKLPDLIVGHGVLGRLLARLTIALGGAAPTVWDINPKRCKGAHGYDVLSPREDPRSDYMSVYDASGAENILNDLISRIGKGGEIVLAGFYAQDLNFAFPPAFLKEVRLRVAAEWTRDDLIQTRALLDSGALSLAGLISHEARAEDAPEAYRTAFSDPSCLKMILNWKDAA